jgi:hypothetical protein
MIHLLSARSYPAHCHIRHSPVCCYGRACGVVSGVDALILIRIGALVSKYVIVVTTSNLDARRIVHTHRLNVLLVLYANSAHVWRVYDMHGSMYAMGPWHSQYEGTCGTPLNRLSWYGGTVFLLFRSSIFFFPISFPFPIVSPPLLL